MELKNFSPAAQVVLLDSQKIAKKNHNTTVEPEHLALALIMTAEIRQLLSKKNIEYKELESSLLELISKLKVSEEGETVFGNRIIQALSAAEALSIKKGNKEIKVSDILLSLLENKEKYGSLGAVLVIHFFGPDFEDKKSLTEKKSLVKDSDLNSFLNINNQIKEGSLNEVFGREQECDRLIQILSRKSCNNAVLIGEPGVGRTSIVMSLAKRIIEQNVPSYFISKEILALDVSALVAGTTLRGQFEERVQKVFDALKREPGKYILFIRDLSLLMGAGGEGVSDAANLLKPRLKTGEIQVIGLVTPDLYKKRIEQDPSFERYFQPLWIEQPSYEECEEILQGLKGSYESFHGVFITDDAIRAAIDLGSKHLSGRVLPEVALDVLDEACSRHRIVVEREPKRLRALNERLLALELKLNAAPKQGEKKLASNKAEYEKLTLEKKKMQLAYERELSLFESMRSLNNNIDKLSKEIKILKDRKDIKKAVSLTENQLGDLKKEFRKKEQELKRIKKADRFLDMWVKPEDIAVIISQETGIPVQRMLESEREKLERMESILSSKVIGQDEAVRAVSSAIRRARVGLKDPKRPIGSFLFLGPTGVGKTELARTLTSFLFDDEKAMVRFDMSEFMERHSVARLLGAPPGYHGSEEGGQLTESIRRKPFSVILFDEIEKAHVDVLNILLQVLDEGRLTDSKGRLVLFNNSVVIMTSNIGASIMLEAKAEQKEVLRALIMERLLESLRPELINRIDEIVIFNAIDKAGISGIADLMLQTLIKRIHDEGYVLHIDDEVKALLIEEGYSREFGARPLKRAIQKLMENPLAMLLVKSVFKKGDHIRASVENKAVTFKAIS